MLHALTSTRCLSLSLALLVTLGLVATPADSAESSPGGRPSWGGVPVVFLEATGDNGHPVLTELDSTSGPAAVLQSCASASAGLAEEMKAFARLAPGQVLPVFIQGEPMPAVAYQTCRAPIPGRSSWKPRELAVSLVNGRKATLHEPRPMIVFSRDWLERADSAELLETMEHELGHALHTLRSPTVGGGYSQTFNVHTMEMRTNARTALAEGFAEYSAFRFNDGPASPQAVAGAAFFQKNNVRAYTSLLWMYWQEFSKSSAIANRLAPSDRSCVGRELLARLRRGGQPPSFIVYQGLLESQLVGLGRPALTQSEIWAATRAFDQANVTAVNNVKDEELTPAERQRLVKAQMRLTLSLIPGMAFSGMDATLTQLRVLQCRTANDLMLNEGAIAHLLFRLDQQYRAEGVDFHGLVLEALGRNPYPDSGKELTPTSFRELVVVLESFPQLAPTLGLRLSKLTGGVLKPAEFVLRPTPERDPLSTLEPGSSLAGALLSRAEVEPASVEQDAPRVEQQNANNAGADAELDFGGLESR